MCEKGTVRLTIRNLCLDDLPFMLKLTGNPAVTRYIPDLINDAGMVRDWLRCLSPEDNEYLIAQRETGEPIGECSLTLQPGSGSCEIGYMLLPEYWGRGYGLETVQWLLALAADRGMTKVTAMTHPENSASKHLLEKLGFRKEAIGWMLQEVMDGMTMDSMETYAWVIKRTEDGQKSSLE